ncbi:hypothetical protein [Methylobacter sp. YRD-M1]|uniref:hypothetical protein n=1 Tax=Methylobacter sp. YRD-M1 TaxID=2911520 RepID=UPI00227B6DEE|nr:hypothetical protein [Methylobacter sp. YRD-M1]WAK04597.1 hypothetical protein LZ558_22340 [Methylobacter sp. YRD-M1]
MSNLKSRPPGKTKQDLDAFLGGAEERVEIKKPQKQKVSYPWEEAGVRDDVIKVYNLRLPEPYLLKLKYIAEHTPDSMQTFCLNVVEEAIDKKIKELTK